MNPKTEAILYRISTTVVYIASLFFVSYVLADCCLTFGKKEIFICFVVSIAATFCYLALDIMYCRDFGFRSDLDRWGTMFACIMMLLGAPMACFILGLLLGVIYK